MDQSNFFMKVEDISDSCYQSGTTGMQIFSKLSMYFFHICTAVIKKLRKWPRLTEKSDSGYLSKYVVSRPHGAQCNILSTSPVSHICKLLFHGPSDKWLRSEYEEIVTYLTIFQQEFILTRTMQ